ncbi:WXG100 family type VII secretion target [Hoyosella sp. YIM 151337]|uniref:WXG100 family type VII secretion target n=1 Tax=Hoyosella sp. YIM 151337 TaxID=2992742 RepID=UPI0022359F71|nr:WXG100 family type VII secretion target [Hoyosella sp. YIM 151337]MCW4352526.1 WXG100 family type VII secretion target [Hoyosella sp. YIM 151337]
MTQQMQTTTATMTSAADRVAQVNSDVQALLGALRGKAAAVNGAWEGEARRAFDALIVRWDSEARKLNDSLLAISDAIRSNGAAYANTQESHASTLNAAGGLLRL